MFEFSVSWIPAKIYAPYYNITMYTCILIITEFYGEIKPYY